MNIHATVLYLIYIRLNRENVKGLKPELINSKKMNNKF